MNNSRDKQGVPACYRSVIGSTAGTPCLSGEAFDAGGYLPQAKNTGVGDEYTFCLLCYTPGGCR